MSKDRFNPTGTQKKSKGKRVVAVSPPAQPQKEPSLARAEMHGIPKAPARATAPAARQPQREVSVAPTAAPEWSMSLEMGLYVLLGAIAFAVRLYALGRFPLQETEGIGAWAAWGIFRGLPDASLAGHSPLPIFGAVFSYLLFGASDVSARLLPALAGGVCAVLPFALRKELGRAAALIASAVLALSPSLVFVSRSMDGGMIVAAGAIVLLACALAYRRDEQDRYIYVGAVTLGVMFAADITAGPTAVILGLLAVLGWWQSSEERELPVLALRNAVIAFVATAVLLGTGLLSNLQGVQTGLVDPLTVWLTGASSGTLGQRAGFYMRVLLAYEPLVLLFAVLGVVAAVASRLSAGGSLSLRAFRRGSEDDAGEEQDNPPARNDDTDETESNELSLTPFLVLWSLLAFACFFLLGDQSPSSVVQVVLPVALLAASFIGHVIETSQLGDTTRSVWLLAIVLILIVLAFVPWFNPTTLFGGRFTSLEKRIQGATTIILALMIFGMAGLAAWFAYHLRLKTTLLAVALALGIALSVYTVHSAWQLNQVNRPNATEPMLLQRTAPDVRMLLKDMQEVSRRQGDDAIPITVDDRLRQPVRWYLRQFINVTTARVGAITKTPIVLVPAEAKDTMSKSLGKDYVNQRYRLLSTWQPEAPLARWLRWAHVRDQVNTPKGEDLYAFYKLPQ